MVVGARRSADLLGFFPHSNIIYRERSVHVTRLQLCDAVMYEPKAAGIFPAVESTPQTIETDLKAKRGQSSTTKVYLIKCPVGLY